MSKGGWFKTPNALVVGKRLPNGKRGAGAVAELSKAEIIALLTFCCYDKATPGTVATVGNLCRRSAERAVASLVAGGHLITVKGKPGRPARRRLLLRPPAPAPEVTPGASAGPPPAPAPEDPRRPCRTTPGASAGLLRLSTKTPDQDSLIKRPSAAASVLLESGFGWSEKRAEELARTHSIDHLRNVIAAVNGNTAVETPLAYAEKLIRDGISRPGANGNGSNRNGNPRRHRNDSERLGFAIAADGS